MQSGHVLGPMEPTALNALPKQSSSIFAKCGLSLESSKLLTDDRDVINLDDDIEKVEAATTPCSSPPSTPTPLDTLLAKPVQYADTRLTLSASIPKQNSDEAVKSWLQKIGSLQSKFNLDASNSTNSPLAVATVANRVVKYQDLPYMGEMTLDNSKPRRGRKPKKADICHLIYKNYGTILPGTPNPQNYLLDSTSIKNRPSAVVDHDDLVAKNQVQNRIISSLLEKRLTQQESKKSNGEHNKPSNQNEPLNLCVRDTNSLKIRLLKTEDNTYTAASFVKSEPPGSDEDCNEEQTKVSLSPSGNFVYWPTAGVFIHPIALQQQLLYYQKMMNSNENSTAPSSPHSLPSVLSSVQSKSSITATDGSQKPPNSINKRPTVDTNHKSGPKRKRSAIFIPPIPAETNTNPATEVSICKFKFTGGAKPTLQEKKMLSVDSGGNFRYYSGTGDKSMRGYEFFPRETLQQQISNGQGVTSSTGAFLQASGEKIDPPNTVHNGKQSMVDFLLTGSGNSALDSSVHQMVPSLDKELKHRHHNHDYHQRKRKSRKSLQREKLEQTFKEKGFLIQTQQLESAEGATYCKFRQLRKFTRYLFRSWKDYLPGNVRELQDGEHIDDDMDAVDELSTHSSELSTTHMN